MSLDQFRTKSLELLTPKSKAPIGDEAKTFSYYLQLGKIDEAGKVVERLLDNNKNEEIYKMFNQFVSGDRKEGVEMLCLFRNLKNNHQKTLLKLILGMKKQVTVEELMENLSLVEKLKISSIDIDIIFGNRCVEAICGKFSDSEKRPFHDVFSSNIFPRILNHAFSEAVPYDDWLKLSLLFFYKRLLESNSNFEFESMALNLVGKTFNILGNEYKIDSRESISGREPQNLFRMWIITRAGWKSWSTKKTYYMLQVLLISFAAIWRDIKSRFHSMHIVKLPFSQSVSDWKKPSSDEQWISSCLGEEFKSHDVHVPDSIKLVLGESAAASFKFPILESLVFVSEVVDLCTHGSHFRKIFCSSAEILEKLSVDTKTQLQSFLQILSNVAPNIFKSWNSAHGAEKQPKVNEIESLGMRYFLDSSNAVLIRDFIKRTTFCWPKIPHFKSLPIYLSGYICLDLTPTTELLYALSLLMHFLVSKLENLIKTNISNDDGLICFIYLMTQLNWPAFSAVENSVTSDIIPKISLSAIKLDDRLCDVLFVPKVIDSFLCFIENRPDCKVYSITFGQNSDDHAKILSHKGCYSIFEKCFANNLENFSSHKNEQLLKYVVQNVDVFSK